RRVRQPRISDAVPRPFLGRRRGLLSVRGADQPQHARAPAAPARDGSRGDQDRRTPAQPRVRRDRHARLARGDRFLRGEPGRLRGVPWLAGSARRGLRGTPVHPRRLPPALEMSPAPRLSLGPLTYYWPREKTLAFYEQALDWPVDIVYLG